MAISEQVRGHHFTNTPWKASYVSKRTPYETLRLWHEAKVA